MPPFNAAPPGGVPPFVADLHIHSKYSRACSRDLTLPNLGWWARRKGIGVLGTGDFTHPAWYDHLRETLQPAEPGLYRLGAEAEADIARRLPPRLADAAEADPVRFMLSVEISTIYKRDDRTRKVHHLIYLPDLDAVARFNTALGRIGNLGSDGRPILGLDSRDLLEITLEASPDGYLVPAHIWTPWFSALGSKSGFDAIADCYADLAEHVFAVETGLSSDPAMNWRVGSLDRYRLVSNSDAHSPPALAREATVFSSARDYFAIRDALRTGDGLAGTIEFFPEEGKYHADGHRLCGVNWSPERTRAAGGRCPECGKPLTVGVLSRVEELADRPDGHRPEHAREVTHLVPLAEILGEINKVGARSKKVEGKLNELVAALGPELEILTRTPVDEIGRVGGELLAEGIGRLRRGDVRRVARLRRRVRRDHPLRPGRAARGRRVGAGDALRRTRAGAAQADGAGGDAEGPATGGGEGRTEAEARADPAATADRLDAVAARAVRADARRDGGGRHRPAGPAGRHAAGGRLRAGRPAADRGRAGHRQDPDADPPDRLPLRGAERLPRAVPGDHLHPAGRRGAAAPPRRPARPGRRGRHRRHVPLARADHPAGERRGGRPAGGFPDRRRRRAGGGAGGGRRRRGPLHGAAAQAGPGRPGRAADPAGRAARAATRSWSGDYRERWRWIFVDEYQDVDAVQYELLRLLSPADGNLCAIGDPDQAIYSFRGADVGYFLRFSEDFTDARLVRLNRNYRSSAPILAAAVAGHRAVVAGPGPPARPGPARPGGPAGRSLPGGVRRRRGRFRGTHRRRPGRRALPPLAGLGADRRPGHHPVLLRHRGALPHRRAGRPDRGRAGPGQHPGAEAVPRPAAGPARGVAIARELRHADGLDRWRWPPGSGSPAR